MTPDFRRIALAAAIAIVATILVVMASRAIFPQPKYPDCELFPRPPVKEQAPEQTEDPECRKQFDQYRVRQESVARNQFFVLLVSAVGVVVLGGFTYGIPVISSGILWGGVISLFVALTASFREGIEDYWRLLAAVVAFIMLVGLSYRLFGKERQS